MTIDQKESQEKRVYFVLTDDPDNFESLRMSSHDLSLFRCQFQNDGQVLVQYESDVAHHQYLAGEQSDDDVSERR